MRGSNLPTLLLLLASTGGALNPQFAAPVRNLTVVRGREAQFTCLVKYLGGYRVGWVKADTKAIQAIHTHVITHNPRVHVSYDDHSTWHLLIKHVTEEDVGPYMCQINTDPFISQMGFLNIITPPEIVDQKSSGDVTVREGAPASLRCVAEGRPQPTVTWQREDGLPILLPGGAGTSVGVPTVQGEELLFPRVSREHIGAYLCIAKNSVPPPVSMRIMLQVHFHPVINVPNQLIGAPYGAIITLQCQVEASPVPVTFWNNKAGDMLSNSTKYRMKRRRKGYTTQLELTILQLAPQDIGPYTCFARNSMGDVSSTVTVYYMPPPTTQAAPSTPSTSQGKRPKNSNSQQKKNKVFSNLHPDSASGEVWMAGSGNPGTRPIDADDGVFLVRSGTSEGEDVLLGGQHWPDGDISSSSNSNFWPPNFILGSSDDESSAAVSSMPSLPSYAICSIPTLLGVLVVLLFTEAYARPIDHQYATPTNTNDPNRPMKNKYTYKLDDSLTDFQNSHEIGALGHEENKFEDLNLTESRYRMLKVFALGNEADG